jgi:hypothetical protein
VDEIRLDLREGAVQLTDGGSIQPQLLASCFAQVDAGQLAELRNYYTLVTKG